MLVSSMYHNVFNARTSKLCVLFLSSGFCGTHNPSAAKWSAMICTYASDMQLARMSAVIGMTIHISRQQELVNGFIVRCTCTANNKKCISFYQLLLSANMYCHADDSRHPGYVQGNIFLFVRCTCTAHNKTVFPFTSSCCQVRFYVRFCQIRTIRMVSSESLPNDVVFGYSVRCFTISPTNYDCPALYLYG